MSEIRILLKFQAEKHIKSNHISDLKKKSSNCWISWERSQEQGTRQWHEDMSNNLEHSAILMTDQWIMTIPSLTGKQSKSVLGLLWNQNLWLLIQWTQVCILAVPHAS